MMHEKCSIFNLIGTLQPSRELPPSALDILKALVELMLSFAATYSFRDICGRLRLCYTSGGSPFSAVLFERRVSESRVPTSRHCV